MSYTAEEVLAYLNDVDDARTVGALLWAVKSYSLVKKNLASGVTYATLRDEYLKTHKDQTTALDEATAGAEREAKVRAVNVRWGSRLLDALEERTGREYAKEGGRRRKSRKTKKSRKSVKKTRKA
jgi:hypothetical protein